MIEKQTFQPLMLESPTGASLALRHMPPSGKVRGVVQINHGLAEHAARYERFAVFLAARGYHAYAHDHRGHGATMAPDAIAGQFARREGAAKVIADVEAVHTHIRQTHPGLPIITFGHSLGGLIALNHAETHPDGLAALAVWNSNFKAGPLGRLAQAILAVETWLMGSDVPSRMLPALTFSAWAKAMPKRRTEFDWLSHDESEVNAYVADPLCGWNATVSMWKSVFDLIFDGGNVERLRRLPANLPVHLIGGAEDPATENGRAVEWLARRMRDCRAGNVTMAILPGTRHESLNEVNRQQTMADFTDWLDMSIVSPR